METTRHIGVDLHRNCFTACTRLENGRNYVTEWKLEQLPKFVNQLRPSDEVAVEMTGNTRLFHDAVAPHVKRVVAVNASQFQVITHSVKKTDPHDARNLALYLAKDLLPEVRMKDKARADRQPDADAGHPGQATHGAQEQDQQPFLGAGAPSQQGIAGQREGTESRSGSAVGCAGGARAKNSGPTDPQLESQHR